MGLKKLEMLNVNVPVFFTMTASCLANNVNPAVIPSASEWARSSVDERSARDMTDWKMRAVFEKHTDIILSSKIITFLLCLKTRIMFIILLNILWSAIYT